MYDKEISGVCPLCRKSYTGRPALSRIDSETMVCPNCGIKQSLESIGVGVTEQEQILEIIHQTYGGQK